MRDNEEKMEVKGTDNKAIKNKIKYTNKKILPTPSLSSSQ